jgi:tetratricopeptide (TPR) repeat protein
MRRARCQSEVFALLALLSFSLPAGRPLLAQPGVDPAEARARHHFDVGQEHFQAGRYEGAIREYQSGYELSRRPGFLLNIAHAYRRMGDLTSARLYYKKFLFVDPTSPKRSEVEATIAQLDELAGGKAAPDRPAPSPAATPIIASPPPPPAHSAEAASLGSGPGEPVAPPFYRRLWFWSAVGVAVLAAGAAVYVVGSQPASPRGPQPTLGTLRR